MCDQSILIVGSIALDTIETPKGARENLLGGSTTYATIAAGRTAPVHVVGVVGNDFPPEGHAIYRRFAADLTDLKVVEGKTFRWGGRYKDNMDERDTLFTELGVFAEFDPQLSERNRKVPWVFLANIHPGLQLSVMGQNDRQQKVVIDTMNLWIETTRKELLAVLKKADVLLINEEEAQLLTGTASERDAAKSLQDLGPRTIVIKRGSRGAVLFDNEDTISVGVYPIEEVIDPTGAGDTFGGGFIAELARDGSFSDALVAGSALASVCVEGFGVERLLQVTTAEIEERKAYLRSTVNA
ncbi:MAG: sugar kinase [FCB group bacterium]|nr:sugar kinase [FCB group bacterium]